MKWNVVLAGCLSVALVGCTTTQVVVEPVTPPATKPSTPAPSGLIYYLPFVEYQAELARELEKCDLQPSTSMLEVWLTQEHENLQRLEEALDNVAGAGPLPEADFDELMKTNLGAAVVQDLGVLLRRHVVRNNGRASLPDPSFDALLRDLVLQVVADGSTSGRPFWPGTLREFLQKLREGKDVGDDLLAELERSFSPKDSYSDVSFEIKVLHEVDVNQEVLPDHSHAYVLMHEKMGGVFKETNLTVDKYDSGVLKSVNATIEDKSGSAISGFLKGALSLASALGGFPLPAAAAGAPPMPAAQAAGQPRAPRTFDDFFAKEKERVDLCAPVRKALEQRAVLAKDLAPINRRIDVLTSKIDETEAAIDLEKTKQTAAAKALQALKDANVPESDPRYVEAKKKVQELEAGVAQLEAKKKADQAARRSLQTQHAAMLAQLGTARDKLTVTVVEVFRPESGNPQVEIRSAAVAMKWFDPALLASFCSSQTDLCYQDPFTNPPVTLPRVLRSHIAAYLPPGISSLNSTKNAVSTLGQGKSKAGHLTYREPARGRLLICQKTPCLDPTFTRIVAASPDIVKEQVVELPQLGILATLPLKSGGFANNFMEAKFKELGSLYYLNYTTKARAEAAATAFAESGQAISDFATAQRGADKQHLDQQKAEVDAEKALIDSQLALEKARDELDAYRRGEVPDTPPADSDNEEQEEEQEEEGTGG